MATIKKFLAWMLGGAILGVVVASLIGPAVLTWYRDPGPGVPVGFNLAPYARGAMNALLGAQAIGALIGAVVLLVIGVLVHRAAARKVPPAPPATPGP